MSCIELGKVGQFVLYCMTKDEKMEVSTSFMEMMHFNKPYERNYGTNTF